MRARGLGVHSLNEELRFVDFDRRELRPNDVLIRIKYSGICWTDLLQAKSASPKSIFPMVPGHEIAGTVEEVGDSVQSLTVGDHVGVGVIVDSCRSCRNCLRSMENYCLKGATPTYNGRDRVSGEPTYGGYSNYMVADSRFVVNIPKAMSLATAAPLLCAGISTYSPLTHWRVGPGSRVGILGLGGLGHMGVQFAKAMGAAVCVLSHSDHKEADARKLGATDWVRLSDVEGLMDRTNSLDLILNTSAGAVSDLSKVLRLLDTDGTLVNLGLPPTPMSIDATPLNVMRRSISGSTIGGMQELHIMFELCQHEAIQPWIELVSASQINNAWLRMESGDVRYRLVLDCGSLEDIDRY